MGPTDEKERAVPFTEEEEVALATGVKEREAILFGKFNSGSVSRHAKERAWIAVTSEINIIGGRNRTVDQVKTKHKNLKAATKKKASENKRSAYKTGGGTSPVHELTTSESILAQTIPNECLNGIEGGIDVHEEVLSFLRPPVATLVLAGDKDNSIVETSCTGIETSKPKSLEEIEATNGTVLPTPCTSKRTYRSSDNSRVEQLMKEQIQESTNLVLAVEKLAEISKTKYTIEERKLILLERLVVAQERICEYKQLKRQKLSENE